MIDLNNLIKESNFNSCGKSDYVLFQGDCLEVMDYLIEQGIKVDAIITDPPYGTTACKWDSVIPFDKMWERLNKLIKPNGAIVLFGKEPFSSALRMSNIKNYKYDLIWEKDKPTNFALANKQPMCYHENISIFYKKQPIYNKQMIEREGKGAWRYNFDISHKNRTIQGTNKKYAGKKEKSNYDIKLKNPKSILYFDTGRRQQLVHPCQKPVPLLEYLIKTYTSENELVLDFTMGSGSTGVACLNTNRKFIGIELDENYFNIAKDRIGNN